MRTKTNAEFMIELGILFGLLSSLVLVIRVFVAGDDLGGVTQALGNAQRQSIVIHNRGCNRIGNELVTNQRVKRVRRHGVELELILIQLNLD